MEKFQVVSGRRLRILKILGADWNGGMAVVNTNIRMNVTGIIVKMRDASQAIVSQNLRMLRDAGLVKTEKIGKEVFYQLADDFEGLVKNLGNPDTEAAKHRALKKGKNRQVIIRFLKENPDSRVCDISPELGRDTVSQELAILRMAGVVEFRKDGVKKFYSMKA